MPRMKNVKYVYDLKQRSGLFALYSFKKLEFFEQVRKIHYFRAGSIKRAGRNFEQNSINEQVLIRASRLENDQNFLVRACSLNRHTRVYVISYNQFYTQIL